MPTPLTALSRVTDTEEAVKADKSRETGAAGHQDACGQGEPREPEATAQHSALTFNTVYYYI